MSNVRKLAANEFTTVKTRACLVCGETGTISLPTDGLVAYNKGLLLQDAFPTVAAGVREQFKTGIHPKCWDELAADDPKD